MQILPSNTERFALTASLTTEPLFSGDRYSTVKNDYTLPQSFSLTPRKKPVWETSPKEKNSKSGHVNIKHRNKNYKHHTHVTGPLWASSSWLTDRMVVGMWNGGRLGLFTDFPVYMRCDLSWAAFVGWAGKVFINGWVAKRGAKDVRSLEESEGQDRGRGENFGDVIQIPKICL